MKGTGIGTEMQVRGAVKWTEVQGRGAVRGIGIQVRGGEGDWNSRKGGEGD